MQRTFRHLASGCVAILVCNACGYLVAQVQRGSDTDWLTGAKLEKSRSTAVSASWNEAPLRNQLQSFARQRNRPIFVDRRVDPTVTQTFDILDRTTEQVVWKVAHANGLGVARIGDLLYVGPLESTSRLPFVIQNIKKSLSKLPKSVRSKWSRRSEINWPVATSTDEIQNWFEQTCEVKFETQLPFDVWPADDWPPLSMIEQLSLIHAGFGLSFEIAEDGSAISQVAFPNFESANLKMKLPRKAKFDIEGAKKSFDDLKIGRSGRTLSVKGPVQSIASFEAWLVQQQVTKDGKVVERTFDLNTTARRGDILATVAQQTNRELVLGDGLIEVLDQRITIDIKNASLEKLLEQCMQGTSLGFEISAKKLTIGPQVGRNR